MLVTLTFDDGNRIQYTRFYPILEKYGLKATFYIVTSNINNPLTMTWQQIRDLYKHGNEIGSHTCTHPDLTEISDHQLDFELRESRNALKPFDAKTLAYPFGKYDDRVIEHAKRYYTAARGMFSLRESQECRDEEFRFNFGLEDERYKLKAVDMEFTIPSKTPLLHLPFSKFTRRMTRMLEENISKKVWVIFSFHGERMVKTSRRVVRAVKSIAVRPSMIVEITKRARDKLYREIKTARRDPVRNFEWLCEHLSSLPIEILNVSQALDKFMPKMTVEAG